MFQRSWVRIPTPYTGWTFVTHICCKNCNDVFLKRPKINDKRGRGWPIFLKRSSHLGIGLARRGIVVNCHFWIEGNGVSYRPRFFASSMNSEKLVERYQE